MISALEYVKQITIMTMKTRNRVIAEYKLIDNEQNTMQIKNIKIHK